MKKMLLFILVGILSLSSLTFSKEEKVEITVSAAASLKEVMEELSEKFQNENKNVKINLNLISDQDYCSVLVERIAELEQEALSAEKNILEHTDKVLS